MKKNLTEIEMVIGNIDDQLVGMGLVQMPAIEEDFVYMKNQNHNYVLSKMVDDEKGILVSPALIPDKRIYRYNELTNEEYYIWWGAETIRKLSEKFLMDGYHVNVTEQHENPVNGVYLIYSWIVENEQDQIITKWGYDVPVGTWCVAYKVMNEDIRRKIRNGEIRGVSIEAFMTEKYDTLGRDNHDLIEIINQLKEELGKIK